MTKAKPKDDQSLFGNDAEPAGDATSAPPARRRNEVARHEPAPPPAFAPPADPFLAMIREVAINPNLDVTKLDALLAMQERILERTNKRAFDEALAKVQPKLPVIDRRGRIEIREKDNRGARTGDIQQESQYAKWEDIVEAVTPIIGRAGFALTFKTGITDKGLVRVVGTLSGHGHREVSDIELQHDSTGSKNNVQAVASSTSYGKRIVGCALLNIVSRGEDDDGFASGGPAVVGDPIDAEQLTKIVDYCEAVECKRENLVKHLNSKRPRGHPEMADISKLPAARFEEALDALRSYEANKKEREKAAQKK